MQKQSKKLNIGAISFSLGIFNIIISFIIYWALWSYINDKLGERLMLILYVINIGSKLEFVTKSLGLVTGIAGLFVKTKPNIYTIIGAIINVVVVLWTLAVYYGLVF